MASTTYAEYFKAPYPTGTAFRPREYKMVELAQNGISTAANLKQAILAANDNDLIVLAPVTITLTEALAISKPLRFKGSSAAGTGGSKITGDFDAALFTIDLAAHSAAAEVSFENISLLQGSDDTDLVTVDNTNAAEALTVRFTSCNLEVLDSSSTGLAVSVTHTTAAESINLIVTGEGTHVCDNITFAIEDAGDVIECHRMKLRKAGAATAIITSTDAVAGQIRLFSCQVPHAAGVSGGHASQLLKSIGGWSLTGSTYAAADTDDFTGSQSEQIVD